MFTLLFFNMMPINLNKKNHFKRLCEAHTDIPLFMQDWWLDAACTQGSTWDVALVFKEPINDENKPEIIAALTYNIRKKYRLFTSISEPFLTPFCGIWFKNKNLLDSEKTEIALKLLEQLPKTTRFSLRFKYNFSPTTAFFLKDFKYEKRQTYILDNLKNIDAVFKNFKDNLKREIKKATAYYTIQTSDDIASFLKLQHLIFKRQNSKNPIPDTIWLKIDAVLKEKKQRTIYIATTTEGVIDAAIYIVWDNNAAYYLASGVTEGGRKNNAVALLLWQAIQDAAPHVPIFDFEGSSISSIAFFFKRFGAVMKEYQCINRKSF
jgi:Acetyltransferase (GNAT) domain